MLLCERGDVVELNDCTAQTKELRNNPPSELTDWLIPYFLKDDDVGNFLAGPDLCAVGDFAQYVTAGAGLVFALDVATGAGAATAGVFVEMEAGVGTAATTTPDVEAGVAELVPRARALSA